MGQQFSSSTEESSSDIQNKPNPSQLKNNSLTTLEQKYPSSSSHPAMEQYKAKVPIAGKRKPTAPSSATASPKGVHVRIASVTMKTTTSPRVRTTPSAASAPRRVHSCSDAEEVGLHSFDVLKLLGKGSHGKVYLVRHKGDGKLYAMKQLRKRQVLARNQVQNTLLEFKVNCKLSERREECPYVAKMHWAFSTQSRLYMVFDYLSGGELFFHIAKRGKLPEHLARFYAAEIAFTLAHLHRNGIVYRDLKPENLMLDNEGHIHMVDFGLCKDGVVSPVKGSNSLCGTTEYLAPEVLCNSGHGFAVDWWAFGMVLHEILTGLPPWYSNDKDSVVRGILHGKLDIPDFVSDDARDLIESLLVRDPYQRLGSSGARQVLNHPFFANVQWEEIASKTVTPGFSPPEDVYGSNFSPEFTKAAVEVERHPQPCLLHDNNNPFRSFVYPSKSPRPVRPLSKKPPTTESGLCEKLKTIRLDESKHSDGESDASRYPSKPNFVFQSPNALQYRLGYNRPKSIDTSCCSTSASSSSPAASPLTYTQSSRGVSTHQVSLVDNNHDMCDVKTKAAISTRNSQKDRRKSSPFSSSTLNNDYKSRSSPHQVGLANEMEHRTNSMKHSSRAAVAV